MMGSWSGKMERDNVVDAIEMEKEDDRASTDNVKERTVCRKPH